MILIDSSTGSRDLIKYPPLDDPNLASLSNLSTSDDTKSSVDVCFVGNGPDETNLMIGIEFKSLGDLLSSIFYGRIQDTQIPAMKAQYDRCWLLYYGDYNCNEMDNLEVSSPQIFEKNEKGQEGYYWTLKGQYMGPFKSRSNAYDSYCDYVSKWREYTFLGSKPMKWGFLESSLLSYSEANIPHKHFRDIGQCAKWVGCLYRWWSKPYHKHKSFKLFDRTPDLRRPAIMSDVDPVTRSIMEVADRIPGIDYGRAFKVASYFPSPISMVSASESEWMKIDGIGPILARAAHRYFRAEKGTSSKVKSDSNGKFNTGLFK